MTIHLPVFEQLAICAVLQKNRRIRKAVVFGSRALGTHRPSSDIDIALWGALDESDLASLHEALDALPLPYLYDIKLFDAIQSDDVRKHIAEKGCVLYEAVS